MQLTVKATSLTLFLTGLLAVASAQPVQLIIEKGSVVELHVDQQTFPINRPIVSYQLGERKFDSSQPSNLAFTITELSPWSWSIAFQNTSSDTVHLQNVVPFSPTDADIFITGEGSHRLSRTHLFQPGRLPVNVIVPDNAWELGYCSFTLKDGNLYGLVRRDINSLKNATRKRFETIIAPGGSVSYFLYAEFFHGPWQEGLRKCFQEKKLYDVKEFDESLYGRKDLQWIRSAYVMHLMMAWDKDYYDGTTGKFNWQKFSKRGQQLYGGDDVICIWPTWPTLGLDPRNQFDMYRDLPGGLNTLRLLADSLRQFKTRFFIAYNPWDESTRQEGHLQGLADLIRVTSADGVVLDTKGESSRELQEAADRVRPGVIMYSEGMAVPKDMPDIVSGRVHNALYYPPMLNLNKLIRPDFAIFRVTEVYKEPILREYALSFFNGYGTEINQFAPGHPEWEEEQYRFLGMTTRILRENSLNFTSNEFTPLVQTRRDSLWVNRWPSGDKTLYTIFSLKPEGFKGPLIEVKPRDGFHWIDIFHHREAAITDFKGRHYAVAELDAFNHSFLGTNNEGQVSCLAELPVLLSCSLMGNQLSVDARNADIVKIWAGDPVYGATPVLLTGGSHQLNFTKMFGRYEGKVVVQAFEKDVLIDEAILFVKPGTARLITTPVKTAKATVLPEGMVKIPAGKFHFIATQGDEFIPYPIENLNTTVEFRTFYMDRYPVTNALFKKFIKESGYVPLDTANFLRHWKHHDIPRGEENFPVVYICYEDAQAYALWAGKRLPTEMEWQYAAQTEKLNPWPWKQTRPVTRKEQFVTETLTVSSLEGIDPGMCNPGNGKPYAVGKYPKGANPFGLQDLVGCVWQLTSDIYESGSYRGIILKGGSYFKPSSSWWYVQGGPRELHYRQYLLRVSGGFERNATVGFRCVKDID